MIVLVIGVVLLGHAAPVLAQPSPGAGESLVALRGRVIVAEASAAPLRGARVEIAGAAGDHLALSDADGWFQARVPAGDWSIRVTKAGYAPAALTATLPVQAPIDVALARGAVITGRVVDGRGDPPAGAVVRVRCVAACAAVGNMPSGTSASIVVVVDDLGAYRAGSLPAGRYAIDLLSSQFAATGIAATALPGPGTSLLPPAGPGNPAALVELAIGQEAVVHLLRGDTDDPAPGSLSPGASPVQVRMPTPIVRGRIVSATGRPVAGASVGLQSITGTGARQATAGPDGRYEIAGLSPGDYRLSVSRGMGFSSIEYGQERAQQLGTPIAIRAGDIIEGLDVRLPATSAITGRVLDAYGEPLEHMNVQVWWRRFSGGRLVLAPVIGSGERQTDDRGFYRLFGLLPGTYYVTAYAGPSTAARIRTSTEARLAGGASITAAADMASITAAADMIAARPIRSSILAASSLPTPPRCASTPASTATASTSRSFPRQARAYTASPSTRPERACAARRR